MNPWNKWCGTIPKKDSTLGYTFLDSKGCQGDSPSDVTAYTQGPNGKEVNAMTTRKTVYRSSKSGEFVTEKFANSHKATTEKEHVYVPAPKTTKNK